jgi:hypothetical protein
MNDRLQLISSTKYRIYRSTYCHRDTQMMTKTMALELAKNNIRANLMAPGVIET